MTEVAYPAAPVISASLRETMDARPARHLEFLKLAAFMVTVFSVQLVLFLAFTEKLVGIGGYGLAHIGSCLAAWFIGRLVRPAGSPDPGAASAHQNFPRIRRTSKLLILVQLIRSKFVKCACSKLGTNLLRAVLVAAPDAGAGSSAVIPLTVASTALLGPFGPVISAALLIPARRSAPEALGPDAASGTPPAPRYEALRRAMLDEHLRLQDAHTVQPLMDVIAEGTPSEKFEALNIVANSYHPSLAPALRLALSDGSAPVRVLAATVTAKLRMTHLKTVGALQAEVAAAPNRAEALRKLAHARIELAASGLFHDTHEREEEARAQEELAEADALDASGG